MKRIALVVTAVILLAGCGSSPYGTRVKEPFSGNAYESNNRFFRSTGKGESSSENIARGKADIEAKTYLAGQVNTTMKQVADNYMGQTQNERGADVAEKFQSLARQVMDTDMADLRKIGEKKYYNEKEKKYTVFIAYEIKKNAMFRFMKKQAKLDNSINESQQALIQKILDEQERLADEEDKEEKK
jgi:glycosidase